MSKLELLSSTACVGSVAVSPTAPGETCQAWDGADSDDPATPDPRHTLHSIPSGPKACPHAARPPPYSEPDSCRNAIPPALYSVPDARRYAGGIGNTKAYELIGQGKWVAVKLCGRTFITADSLNAFIAGLPRADIRTGQRNTAA